MKTLKRKVVVATSCLMLSMIFFAASAFALTGIGLNNVAAQVQEKSSWCWAATSSMAAKYLGATNATQSNIVTAVFGSTWDFAGTVYDMQTGLSAYSVYSTPRLSNISFLQVTNNIDMKSTVIAGIKYHDASRTIGHALLVRGYYFNTANSQQNLYYIDPADASSNVMSYSSFNNNSSWYWINTLDNIYK